MEYQNTCILLREFSVPSILVGSLVNIVMGEMPFDLVHCLDLKLYTAFRRLNLSPSSGRRKVYSVRPVG
jgi:hypothetical protein